MNRLVLCLIVSLCSYGPAGAAGPDEVIADFEGGDYGAWRVTGEAFGPGPARGTLPGQMHVSGFEGKGLVNTFFKGDRSVGTLTSPLFVIKRRFINFLIGGGMHPGQTCINLLVDGKVVRTATGPNDKPGGTERLDWHSWDVSDLTGREAVIQIVDAHRGGWGHINVDQIVQSDRRQGTVETLRELTIRHDYLSFRFAAGQGPRTQISLTVDGRTLYRSVGAGRAEACWITWDVSRQKGKTGQLTVVELPLADGTCPLAQSVVHDDQVRGPLVVVDRLYQETYRPQFHFTPKKNWTNDPNGLVYYQGEYHLFFQHNPFGIHWGNMTWGHAVSPDLVHWTQLDHAIKPDRLGTIFSGSAVVDWNNTAGFQTGQEKVLVAIYTSAGSHAPVKVPFTQSIAYSNDRGRTWTKYQGNPVLGHIVGHNRDPKVIWHEPTRKWVMALYLDKNDYALFGSTDLKSWKRLCGVAMPGTRECPDLFELPVDGDLNHTKWVFWGANGNYRLGTFDGAVFTPETEPLRSCYGANDYAAQTYSDIPPADGRRIQISWMAGGKYPGMPFNQQMSFPRELTLRSTPDGVRLFMQPVREIATLRAGQHHWSNLALEPGRPPLQLAEGELWEILAELEPGQAAEVGLQIRGQKLRYDTAARTLHCLGRSAPLGSQDGCVTLHVLVDRTSIEVFADDGRVVMCTCFLPDLWDRSLRIYAKGGTARARSLTVYALRSAWRR